MGGSRGGGKFKLGNQEVVGNLSERTKKMWEI